MRTLALVLTVALAGCAAPITERASKIQVHSQMSTLLANCKVLGPVSAEAPGSMVDASPGTQAAKNLARDKVSEMGGDTLVITNIDHMEGQLLITPAKAAVQGTALKCY